MAVPVIMPKFEMSQETARLIAWRVAEGQPVRQGEPLLDVETDKITMEVEAPASGILSGLRAQAGDVVPVTSVIAQILVPGEAGAPEQPAQTPPPAAGPGSVARTVPRITPVAQRLAADLAVDLGAVAGSGPGGRITKADVIASVAAQPEPRPRATPAARRIAHEADMALTDIAGSGPRGRIQAVDVRRAVASAEPPPLAPTAGPLLSLSNMRAAIARRMTESYQRAPHIHLTRSADVTAAEAARRRWAAQSGGRISLTVLLVKACAWTLRRHPAVNATFEPQGIRLRPEVNIGVAVALPDGLIVPVLRRADARPLADLAEELAQLAEQSKAGTLRPDQVSDGTFTLTNLGKFGIEAFDPILNPPQVAILGVGAVVETVVPLDGQIVVRPRMQLTLAVDHRALDGAVAAQFLQDVCRAIEDPTVMLV